MPNNGQMIARRGSGYGTLSRMTSSIGVMDAILVETEKRRRGSRPGRVRGSIDARWGMWRVKRRVRIEECGAK